MRMTHYDILNIKRDCDFKRRKIAAVLILVIVTFIKVTTLNVNKHKWINLFDTILFYAT